MDRDADRNDDDDVLDGSEQCLAHWGLLSVTMVGEPPGRAHVQTRARVQQALGVDAAGEPDERVDRGDHEYEREHVLP